MIWHPSTWDLFKLVLFLESLTTVLSWTANQSAVSHSSPTPNEARGWSCDWWRWLTVQQEVKGRPQTWASCLLLLTDSSLPSSPAGLHTCLNPTEGRYSEWWSELPSHWLGSLPLHQHTNSLSHVKSVETVCQCVFWQKVMTRFLWNLVGR